MQSEVVTAPVVRLWLLSRLGDSGRCLVRGPVHRRYNSRVFYAECDRLPSAAAIKWCLQSQKLQMDAAGAAAQFDALRRVGDAMRGNARFNVPRTYLLERDRALLAIEWIDGQTMTASMRSWRCGVQRAQALLVQAGDWLRHFHAANPLSEGGLDVDDKLQHLAEYDGCSLLRDPVFAAGIAELRRSARDAALAPLKHSWIHGDFKSDNLIVDRQRVIGIDVQIRNENSVVYDLASFINHFALALFHPALWRLARARTRLITAFVDAYSEARSAPLWLPLNWMRLYLMLAAWHTANLRDAGRLHAAAVEFRFRRATAALIAEIGCEQRE